MNVKKYELMAIWSCCTRPLACEDKETRCECKNIGVNLNKYELMAFWSCCTRPLACENEETRCECKNIGVNLNKYELMAFWSCCTRPLAWEDEETRCECKKKSLLCSFYARKDSEAVLGVCFPASQPPWRSPLGWGALWPLA